MTNNEIAAMRQALEALESSRQTHHYCEDTWYSCPKHEEGCANEAEGDECNCGADETNAVIDAAITSLRAAIASYSHAHSAQAIDAASQLQEAEQGRSSVKQECCGNPFKCKGNCVDKEPVAWRWKYKFRDIGETGAYEYHSHEFACLTHMPEGEPLYTSPPTQCHHCLQRPAAVGEDIRKPLTDKQKDAARWRFLVDNSFDKDGVTQFHVWEHSWEPHSQTGEPTEWKQRVRGPALDRFIDRAIEAAHGIKGGA